MKRETILQVAVGALLAVGVMSVTASPGVTDRMSHYQKDRGATHERSVGNRLPAKGEKRGKARKISEPGQNSNLLRTGSLGSAEGRSNKVQAPRQNDALGKLRGNIVYEESWKTTQVNKSRIVEIDLSTQTVSDVKAGPYGSYGAVKYGGRYFTSNVNAISGYILSQTNTIYSADDWSVISTGSYAPRDFQAADMTYDADSGMIYGSFYTEEAWIFGSFDPEHCSVYPISEIGDKPWYGVAVNAEGQIYAIDGEGVLFKVDKTNGAATKVADTGVKSVYACSAEFNPADNKLYYTPNAPEYSELWSIDVTDGSAVKICDLPDKAQIKGLYFDASTAGAVPGLATELKIDVPDGALAGNVTFKAPESLSDGSSVSGQVTYRVMDNGSQVATGNVAYGADVSVPYSTNVIGLHTLTVCFSNVAGQGDYVRATKYLGPDVPLQPSNLQLVYEEGKFKISWDAPEMGEHGVSVDANNLTYRVTCYPSGAVVGDNVKGDSLAYAVEDPDTLTIYYFGVEANNLGYKAPEVLTRGYALGSFRPAFRFDTDSEQKVSACTVIDGGNDGKTWEWNSYRGVARCQFSGANPKDEWLILPKMHLEAGKSYLVSFRIGCENSGYTERLGVYVGTSPDVGNMTDILIAPFDFNTMWDRGGMLKEKYYTPSQTGDYYLGFHAVSDVNKYWIFLSEISVGEAVSSQAPGAPSNVSVTPSPDGSLKATVDFTTPAVDVVGNPVDAITKVEVLRGGKVIGEVSPLPAAGAAGSFVDNSAQAGDNEYTVVAYNKYGRGIEVKASAFVGFDVPVKPDNVKAVKAQGSNQVTLSWNPVTQDVNGLIYPQGTVTYSVYMFDSRFRQEVATNLTATELKLNVNVDEGQTMIYFGVLGETTSGRGEGGASNLLCVGEPYNLPFKTTLVDGNLNYVWGVEDLTDGASWMVDYELLEGYDADGDGYYLCFYGEEEEAQSQIVSGLVRIPDNAVKPMLKFYYFPYGSENTIDVVVSSDGTTFQSVWSHDMMLEAEEWVEAAVDLSAYKGKEIRVGFLGTIVDDEFALVDAPIVYDEKDLDIGIESFSLPSVVEGNKPVTVETRLINNGLKDAAGYKVDIYRDEKIVKTLTGDTIKSGESLVLKYEDQDVPETYLVKYKAVVTLAGDQDNTNDASEVKEVAVLPVNCPAPVGLAAAAGPDGVSLSWNAPDMSTLPHDISTDDFEDYQAGTTGSIGTWKSVKADKGLNGSIKNMEIPGISSGVSRNAFVVLDAEDLSSSMAPHSGSKCLVSMFNIDDSAVDHWLISPELSGARQVISFFARSYQNDYPENVEVYYSTTGSDPEDFKAVKDSKISKVPQVWTQYTALLPAGAKYVALRTTSAAAFMLMIDDVTIQPASTPVISMDLKGYNVYRDGVRVNAEVVDAVTYLDKEADIQAHKYAVTAVYDIGESDHSEEAEVSGAAPVRNGPQIMSADGIMYITGAEGEKLAVSDASGKVIYSTDDAGARVSIPVCPGVYVVRTAKTVRKVMVK